MPPRGSTLVVGVLLVCFAFALLAVRSTDASLAAVVPPRSMLEAWVAPGGNDTTANGSLVLPFASVQAALDAVADNGTVLLANGSYHVPMPAGIVVRDRYNVTLRGVGAQLSRLWCTPSTGDVDSPAINVTHSPFVRLVALSVAGCTGGGVAFDEDSRGATIEHAEFARCGASDYVYGPPRGGGALLLGPASTVIDVIFVGNEAQLEGGGLWVNGIGSVLANLNFTENLLLQPQDQSAQQRGAGLFCTNASGDQLFGSVFLNNAADSFRQPIQGSAMYLLGADVTLRHLTFLNNGDGDNYDGTCYVQADNLRVEACVWLNNQVNNWGGGLCAFGSNVSLVDSTFSGNSGWRGGGASIIGAHARVSNCTFSLNSVHQSGGGLFLLSDNATVEGASFDNNQAGYRGGGLGVIGVGATIGACFFGFNSASNAGGGAHVEGDRAIVGLSVFTGNAANTNGDSAGGGLALIGNGSQAFGSNFSANTANGAGSGVLLQGDDVQLCNSTLAANSGYGTGAAVTIGERALVGNVSLVGNRCYTSCGTGGLCTACTAGLALSGSATLVNSAIVNSSCLCGYFWGLSLCEAADTFIATGCSVSIERGVLDSVVVADTLCSSHACAGAGVSITDAGTRVRDVLISNTVCAATSSVAGCGLSVLVALNTSLAGVRIVSTSCSLDLQSGVLVQGCGLFASGTGIDVTDLSIDSVGVAAQSGQLQGGGIYLVNGSLSNSTISRCFVSAERGSGGGVYVVSGGVRDVVVTHSQFELMFPDSGGAIYVGRGDVDSVAVADSLCSIQSNDDTASVSGCGIALGVGSLRDSIVVRSLVTVAQAPDGDLRYDPVLVQGVAAFVGGGRVERCQFLNNSVTIATAITTTAYAVSVTAGLFVLQADLLDSLVFEHNSVGEGMWLNGTAAFVGSAQLIRNCSFISTSSGRTTRGFGAALNVIYASVLEQCRFVNNSCGQCVGGLAIGSGVVLASVFERNSAASGAALAAWSATILDCVFVSNSFSGQPQRIEDGHPPAVVFASASTLERCNLTDSYGGAVVLTSSAAMRDSNVTLSRNPLQTFLELASAGCVGVFGASSLSRANVSQCSSLSDGGCVYASGGATVSDVSASLCSSFGNGGCVYATGGASVSDVRLSRCTASQSGGGAFVVDALVRSVRVESASALSGDGGGLWLSGPAAIASNISVLHCSAGSSGGGLFVSDAAVARDVVVSHCSASTSGGGVAAANATLRDLVVRDCSLVNGNGGGGVDLRLAGVIERAVVENNMCLGSSCAGGGLALAAPSPAARIVLRDATVRFNTAQGLGGGGVFASGVVVVQGCNITGNIVTQASANGGGAWLNGATLADSLVVGNWLATGGYGGGVCSLGASTLANVTVADNVCAGAPCCGGGIATHYEPLGATAFAALSINASRLLRNRADLGTGGALCALQSVAFSVSATVVEANRAQQGGGLACAGSGFESITLVNTSLVQNSALGVQGASGDESDAGGGGGIVASESCRVFVSGCAVTNNVALRSGHGGAALVLNSAELSVSDSTLSGNIAADAYGGAVSVASSSTVSLSSVHFANNSAAFGGALAVSAAWLSAGNVATWLSTGLSDCRFEANVAAATGESLFLGGGAGGAAFVDVSAVPTDGLLQNVSVVLQRLVDMSAPPAIPASLSNVAVYGDSVATSPFALNLSTGDAWPGAFVDIEVDLLDLLGNVMPTQGGVLVRVSWTAQPIAGELRSLCGVQTVAGPSARALSERRASRAGSSASGSAVIVSSSGAARAQLQAFGAPGDVIVFNASFALSSQSVLSRASIVTVVLAECPAGYGYLAATSACDYCAESTYTLDPSLACHSCPSHLQCLGGDDVSIGDNYWPLMDPATGSVTPLPCPFDFCSRGAPAPLINVTQYCKPGSHRNASTLLCGTCDEGYSAWDQACLPCAEPSAAQTLFHLAKTFGFVVLVFALAQGAAGRSGMQVLLFVYQTASLAVYPHELAPQLFALASFRLPSSGSNCPFDVSAYGALAVSLSGVLVNLALLALLAGLHRALAVLVLKRHCCIVRVLRARRTLVRGSHAVVRAASLDSYVRGALAIVIDAYQPLVATALGFLACEPTLNVVFLRPSVSCGTPEYATARGVLLALLALLGLAPAAVVATLAVARRRSHGSLVPLTARYGKLFAGYRPALFWWKAVEMWRRAAMVAAFVGLQTQPGDEALTLAKLSLTVSVAVFAVVQVAVHPYEARLQNAFEMLSFVAVAVLACIFLPTAVAGDALEHERLVLGAVLLALFALVFLLPTAAPLGRKILERIRARKPMSAGDADAARARWVCRPMCCRRGDVPGRGRGRDRDAFGTSLLVPLAEMDHEAPSQETATVV